MARQWEAYLANNDAEELGQALASIARFLLTHLRARQADSGRAGEREAAAAADSERDTDSERDQSGVQGGAMFAVNSSTLPEREASVRAAPAVPAVRPCLPCTHACAR